jgi:hypothetical protein
MIQKNVMFMIKLNIIFIRKIRATINKNNTITRIDNMIRIKKEHILLILKHLKIELNYIDINLR